MRFGDRGEIQKGLRNRGFALTVSSPVLHERGLLLFRHLFAVVVEDLNEIFVPRVLLKKIGLSMLRPHVFTSLCRCFVVTRDDAVFSCGFNKLASRRKVRISATQVL